MVLFQINAETLPSSEAFPYLDRLISYNNSDWLAVYQNLVMVAGVLERTGATVQSRGEIYKMMTQLVLLYGSKRWVMTGEMLKVLEGFHHQSTPRITGMTEKLWAGGE